MQLVQALHYKPAGSGFDSGWCHLNPSGGTMAQGSIEPLKEPSARNISLEVKKAGS